MPTSVPCWALTGAACLELFIEGRTPKSDLRDLRVLACDFLTVRVKPASASSVAVAVAKLIVLFIVVCLIYINSNTFWVTCVKVCDSLSTGLHVA